MTLRGRSSFTIFKDVIHARLFIAFICDDHYHSVLKTTEEETVLATDCSSIVFS